MILLDIMRNSCCAAMIHVATLLLVSANMCGSASLTDNQGTQIFHQSTTTTTISPARAPIFREANHDSRSQPDASACSTGRNVSTKPEGDKKDAPPLSAMQARLMREFREIRKSDSHKRGVIEVELENESNLQEWKVKLAIAEGCSLHKDLLTLKGMGGPDHVMLRVSFGDNYPTEPPFVMVDYPILGSGYVNLDNSLCMDILTGHGWNSSFTIEAFLLMILSGLQESEVRVWYDKSLKERHASERRAREAFEGLRKFHDKWGWR